MRDVRLFQPADFFRTEFNRNCLNGIIYMMHFGGTDNWRNMARKTDLRYIQL
jgi:hypothetical protein